ncbi:hypothetical protein KEM54_001321 [Ascosphaera aggregata]|nr:hypothetical protein KEM54_001321 [Ascosphaera aggregata]
MDAPIESLISPTRARQAALQAKDWALVTSWLTRIYAPNPVPAFERNEDTLSALLDLAAANSAADEQVRLVQQAEKDILGHLKAQQKCLDDDLLRNDLFNTVEAALGEEGAVCIDEIAGVSAVLGIPNAEASEIGSAIIDMTREEHHSQQEMHQTNALLGRLEKDLAEVRQQLEEMKNNEAFQIPADLPTQTSEHIREIKLLNKKIDEYSSQLAGVLNRGQNAFSKTLRLEDILDDEQRVMELKKAIQSLQVENTSRVPNPE